MFWRPFSFSPGVSGWTCPTWPFRQRFSIANVQKDCQNRKREIGYMPLENCSFLKIAYFKSLFSIWLWFLPNKERRQGGERELIYCLPCLWGICRRGGIWNPESGMGNSQSFKYSPVRVFLFLFVENHFTFTITISSFNLQDIEQNA